MQAANPALAIEHATEDSNMNTFLLCNDLSQRTTDFRLTSSFCS
jgi:hypothetical protein